MSLIEEVFNSGMTLSGVILWRECSFAGQPYLLFGRIPYWKFAPPGSARIKKTDHNLSKNNQSKV